MTAAGSPGSRPERLDAAGEGQTPADTASALLTTIWPLLGRHIAFHRRLVDLTGNVKAALLLSQAVYWTRHGRDIAQRDGWFHKTAEQWELELGLAASEQQSAEGQVAGGGGEIAGHGGEGHGCRSHPSLECEGVAAIPHSASPGIGKGHCHRNRVSASRIRARVLRGPRRLRSTRI